MTYNNLTRSFFCCVFSQEHKGYILIGICLLPYDEDRPNEFIHLQESGKDTVERYVMCVLMNYRWGSAKRRAKNLRFTRTRLRFGINGNR